MTGENAWVIGRGLLGRAVEKARGVEPTNRAVRWSDPATAIADLRAHVAEFAETPGPLEIYWCAGRGVTSTPREELDVEVDVFDRALQEFADVLGRRDVRVFLASSVGGAYALAPEPPFTEHTPVSPGSHYGVAKLEMEDRLAAVAERMGWRTLAGRITNLYGPGQDMAKGQGLISVITDSYVTGKPVSLYVSLDTLRDYIYEDDCARVIVAAMGRLSGEPAGSSVVKIIGAMTAVSIGALLGEATRLRRQRSRITLGMGRAGGQASDLRVRSVVWPDLDALVSTTLPEGLDKVFRARLMAQGSPRR
jgi:UDP-glucose 4-epimerase